MYTLGDPGYQLRLAESTMRTLGFVRLSIGLNSNKLQSKSQSTFTYRSLRRIFVATLEQAAACKCHPSRSGYNSR